MLTVFFRLQELPADRGSSLVLIVSMSFLKWSINVYHGKLLSIRLLKKQKNKTVIIERLNLSHRQNVNLAIKTNIYLTGFAKTWLKKFQVHFNNLTSNWNGK